MAEISGDAVAVETMVYRLVHHSHILSLKGDSYRLKDKQDELATTNEQPLNRAEFNRR